VNDEEEIRTKDYVSGTWTKNFGDSFRRNLLVFCSFIYSIAGWREETREDGNVCVISFLTLPPQLFSDLSKTPIDEQKYSR
jgi:hypothetical protein